MDARVDGTTLLVLAATRFELAGTRGRDGGARVVVVTTGIGRAGIERAVSRALARRPTAVLSLGLAGGLRPGLAVGTPLVIEDVCTPDAHDPPLALDPALRHWALRMLRPDGAREEKLVTATGVVDTPEAKIALGGATGAAAVDMEGYWLAGLAARAGVPLLLLKVICDTAEMPVPAAAWLASAAWWRLARRLATRPREAAEMARLVSAALAARRALVPLSRRLVASWRLQPGVAA